MASCGTITVLPKFNEGDVTATCSIDNEELSPGSTATVTATIENANNADAAYSLEVSAGGAGSEQRSGTVRTNGSTTESVQFTFPNTGSYNVELSLTAERA